MYVSSSFVYKTFRTIDNLSNTPSIWPGTRNHMKFIISAKKVKYFISVYWFLSRVSTVTFYINIAILSVRPSVRHVPVFYRNDATHCHSFSTARSPKHSSFTSIEHLRKISTGPSPAVALNTDGYKNFASFDQQFAISRKRYKIAP